eukprot:3270880-Amphidinium_carterae.1
MCIRDRWFPVKFGSRPVTSTFEPGFKKLLVWKLFQQAGHNLENVLGKQICTCSYYSQCCHHLVAEAMAKYSAQIVEILRSFQQQ